jgi:hypothetical protein
MSDIRQSMDFKNQFMSGQGFAGEPDRSGFPFDHAEARAKASTAGAQQGTARDALMAITVT